MYLLCGIVLVLILLRRMGSQTGEALWPLTNLLLGILILLLLLRIFFFSWPFAVCVLIILAATIKKRN